MKKIIAIVTLIIIIAGGAFYLQQSASTPEQSDKPKVAATIFPLYDLTRTIAGDTVDVALILPPGASPHTYDASPEDLKNIQNAEAVFMIGNGLDDWSQELAQSAGVSNIVVVDQMVTLQDFAEYDEHHDDEEAHEDEVEHEEEDGHAHEGTDPHYWLSVDNAIGMASQITEELTALYPENAQIYDDNFAALEQELIALDEELVELFSSKKSNEIATFHNAWGYFATSYDLSVVTTFEEFPGESPSPEYLKEFSEKVTEYNLSTVFTEPQLATKALDPIAQDLNVSIMVIDPIGGVDGLTSYSDLLRYNGLQISKSL